MQYTGEGDSALGDEISAYTTSLVSSVLANTYEYGRRYHAYKDSDYVLPNDEIELDRLDMTHHIMKLMRHGKLLEAPIPKNVQRVLDIGCGTGIWALEFADNYPSAEVLGVDLAPNQPNFVPPNLKFEIDDVEGEFSYPAPFDYVHCRYMAFSIRDWPRLFRQIHDHTAPGGFVEFTDYNLNYRSDDNSLEGTVLQQWSDDLSRAGRKMGVEPHPGPKLDQWARDAGFTNVVHKVYKLPLGPWPKDAHYKQLGAWKHIMTTQGLDGFTLRLFIKVLGWDPDEVQVLLVKVRKDMNDRKIHSYVEVHKVWGQKPSVSTA